MWYIFYMTITPAQREILMNSLKDSISARAAEQESARVARLKREAEKKEDRQAVEAGLTTVTRRRESQLAKEKRIREEGMENLGRSPEDIVIGKRQVFDPAIGNRK